MTEIKDKDGRPGYSAAMNARSLGPQRPGPLWHMLWGALWTALALSAIAAPGLAQAPQNPDYDLWAEQPPAKVWTPDILTPMHEQRTERHRAFIQGGVPVEYLNQSSPYPKAGGVIRDGSKVYAEHCVACHGPRGMGDGNAGKDLAPSPALLSYLEREPKTADGYLLWTITEGGQAFGSEMPALKDLLSEREIWQVVIYMRAGFPESR